jgi:hypothetical protein
MWRFRGGQKEGMKKGALSTLLLVLLVLSIMPLTFPFVVDSGFYDPPRNPSILVTNSISSSKKYNFSWTSRWQEVPQEIVNGSSIAGDHIVINSLWDLPVTSSNITIVGNSIDDIVIENEPSTPTEVSFDTYFLLRNATVNLTLSATYNSDVLLVEYIGITFGNYFLPEVEFVGPNYNPIHDEIVNITWTCSDQNANDTNYFTVWLSVDGGATFQLFAQNLTTYYCLWNSIGWIDEDYTYRIRAYSLDFTTKVNGSPLCSTVNPPTSYWPGDYADVVSTSWAHNGPPVTTTAISTETTTTMTTIPDNSLFALSIGVGAGMISGLAVIVVLRQRYLLKRKVSA